MIKTSVFIIGILLLAQAAMAQFYYGDYSVRVEVEGNGFAHFTEIYFEDGLNPPQGEPTYGWDGCCDALLTIGNPNQPHVFTKVVVPGTPPVNNHRMSINGLPHLYETTIVPLGFLPGTLAQYSFTFEELWRLPAGVTVEFQDLTQNVTQDLLLDSTYTTWGAVSDDEDRFELHFSPENVTSVESETTNQPKVWIDSENIFLGGLDSNLPHEIRMYDVLGKVLLEKSMVSGETKTLLSRKAAPRGIYILEIVSGKETRNTVKISL
jgi:hypothetical protein